MEELVRSIQDVGIGLGRTGPSIVGEAIGSSPLMAAGLAGLVLATALFSRSPSFTFASAICAGIALLSTGMPRFADVQASVTAAVVCTQLLMIAGAWGFRRRIAREVSKFSKLLTENKAFQQRLDEEIRWRRASESTEE